MKILQHHLPESLWGGRLVPTASVIHYVSNVVRNPKDPYSPAAIRDLFAEYKVSAHYLIDRAGTIIELVPPNRVAWHAGRSIMNGREECNRYALGVELVSTGYARDGEPAYTEAQYLSCIELHTEWQQRNGLRREWIQGHDKVRANWNTKHPELAAPAKFDPGPEFDWLRFYQALGG